MNQELFQSTEGATFSIPDFETAILVLDQLSDEQVILVASQVLQFLKSQSDNRLVGAMEDILRHFGLYNSKSLSKSWLYQIVTTDPAIAREVLRSFVISGRYPAVILEQALNEAMRRYEKKTRRNRGLGQAWRGFKILTIINAVRGDSMVTSEDGYIQGVVLTVLLWVIIDRITADPPERGLAEAGALMAILRRALIGASLPEPDFEKVAQLRTGGSEVDVAATATVEMWFEQVTALLSAGISPHAILKILRRSTNSPFYLKVSAVEEKRMQVIHEKMTTLQDLADSSMKVQENAVQQLEAITALRNQRQSIAVQMLYKQQKLHDQTTDSPRQ